MKNWLVIFLLCQVSCIDRSIQENFQLQKGDFLFQDLDSSPLCDAIELVTPGYKGANLSHIGMVVELGDPYCINPSPRLLMELHLILLPLGEPSTRFLKRETFQSPYYNNSKNN